MWPKRAARYQGAATDSWWRGRHGRRGQCATMRHACLSCATYYVNIGLASNWHSAEPAGRVHTDLLLRGPRSGAHSARNPAGKLPAGAIYCSKHDDVETQHCMPPHICATIERHAHQREPAAAQHDQPPRAKLMFACISCATSYASIG